MQHFSDRDPYCGEKLTQLGGLLNVADGTHETRTMPVTPCLGRSDDCNRDVSEVRRLPQYPEHFKAVALGRVQIEENGIGMECVRFRAVYIHRQSQKMIIAMAEQSPREFDQIIAAYRLPESIADSLHRIVNGVKLHPRR